MIFYKLFNKLVLGISNEENCAILMTDVFKELKKIVTETKFYRGIENEKTLGALINLISQVIKVSNDEVAIMSLKCLKFLALTLD